MYRSVCLLASLAYAFSQTPPRLLEDADWSWISDYSIHYEYCFHSDNFVSFRLCPQNDSCEAGCRNGGEYLMDVGSFTSAFIAAQENFQASICEDVLNNCQNDDGNEYQCYEKAGAYFCMDDDENEAMDIDNYLSCQQIGEDLYAGPYCGQDNRMINLGVFVDEDCIEFAEDGAFEAAFGFSMPYGWYTGQSVVSDDCIPCQSFNDNDQQSGTLEQCTYLYQAASAKCEANMDMENADVDGCDAIEQMKKEEGIRTARNGGGKTLLIVTMLVLVAVLTFGVLWFYKRAKRTQHEKASSQNLI